MLEYIIFIVLVLVCAFSVLVFGVDFYFFLINRYCRFHIGRWYDDKVWETAIYKVAVKWSKITPTVKITDNTRYILLDIFNGKYRSQSIQSWQNAAIILGLLEKGDLKTAQVSIERFVDKNGNWKKRPIAVDAGMLAYSILKGTENIESIKPAMDYMISLIRENIDDNGLVSYTGGKDNQERYVDTLGLVCPFLALYAKVYGKSEYMVMAYKQLEFYHNYGLLLNTNLPNHAVNADSKIPLGVYGWGRGVAWYVIGLLDTYLGMQECVYKMYIKQWILDAADSYLEFQHSDGGFGSELQRLSTYDSSCTATLAYFYFQCAEIFKNKKYLVVAKKCLVKLKSVTRITGKIDWCQGDTKGIGIFAQTYDIMPFAQGLALRAIEIQKRITRE